MHNNAIIARLQEIGPMPDDSTPAIEAYPLKEFDELLQQLPEPLEPSHSLALINLGPPRDASAYELEWALVHAAERVSAEELQSVLVLADKSGWRII
jgi:hypothetical protein